MASNIELSNKRVESAKYRIAKCLNMLEATAQELHWTCEAEEWNDDVAIHHSAYTVRALVHALFVRYNYAKALYVHMSFSLD